MVTDTGSVIVIATEITLSRIQREASRVVVQVSVSSVCAVHTQRATAGPQEKWPTSPEKFNIYFLQYFQRLLCAYPCWDWPRPW